jgi:hypothetical protein
LPNVSANVLKLGVPVRDLGRLAAGVVLILGEGFGVLFVVFAPLFEIILAANYLDIKPLLYVLSFCLTVYSRVY